MDGRQTETEGWVERPMAARAVGLVAYGIPFVASVAVAILLSASLPAASTVGWGIIRWVCVAAISTVALVVVERQTRRLLPLRALLGLTLAFPDRAPSRFRIAIRTGTTNQLRERLAEARAGRLGDTPSEAARRLLELVGMLSLHDRTTRGHSERVRAYTHLIAEEMGFSGTELDRLRWAGLLHDVGKLAISGDILNKPGKLTADEYDIIKTHPMEGKRLVQPLAEWLGESVRAVWEHHERWDGGGYPLGLARTEISQAARIVSVADTYDVMTSVRSYKAASSAAEARRELARCAGTQFDPECVKAFLAVSVSRVRGTMGPLSLLAQLSLFPQSVAAQAGPVLATTAAVTAGAAAGTVGMAAGPIGPVQTDDEVAVETVVDYDVFELLAPAATSVIVRSSVDSAMIEVELAPQPTPDPTGIAPAPAITTPPPGASGPTVATATSTRPSTQPTSVAPSTSIAASTGPATTTPRTVPAVTTTVATTVPPTTVPPTTAPPPTVPSTTVPPTTVPPTAVPPLPQIVGDLFLASSDIGPVRSSPELPLTVAEPVEFWLYNYDTDRDNDEGLVLEASDVGVDSRGSEEVQLFRHPLVGVIDGGVRVRLYVAAEDFDDEDVIVEVSIRRCSPQGACETLARDDKTVNNARYFKSVNISFGSVDATFEPGDELELRVAVLDGGESAWLAYGTTVFPSAISFGD